MAGAASTSSPWRPAAGSRSRCSARLFRPGGGTAPRRTVRRAVQGRPGRAGRGSTPAQRLDHVERILGRELFPVIPNILPLPALGFALLAAAGKLLGSRAEPGELQAVLRGLPNNVTTEMDLALWQLAAAIRADAGAAAVFAGRRAVPELVRRYRAGELPAVVQSGLAAFLGRYGHRAVAEIDLGMPRWSDDPSHILGVLANYLRLEDPGLAPDRQFSKAAREAEAHVGRLAAAAGERSRLRGALVRAALQADPPVCRAARAAEVPHRGGPRGGAGAARSRRGRTGRGRGASAPPTTSSSWIWPRPGRARRRGAAQPRGRSAGKPTQRNWAAGTFPGCCSRTAPSPRRCRHRAAGGAGPDTGRRRAR